MFPKGNLAVTRWVQRSMKKLFLLLSLLLSHAAHLEGKRDNQFIWKPGPWGRCTGDCGPGGVQTRALWCFHFEGWTSHLSNCDENNRPPKERSCFRVCDWHSDLFQWEVSDWHHCMLVPSAQGHAKPRTAECVTAQHGLQHRTVRCIQKLNRTMVANEICEHFAPQPPTEQACLIPCPRDCVVSEFSQWSKCSKGCGKQVQHRTREAIAPPLYGGSQCPNLTESRTCEVPVSCPLGEEEYTFSLKVGPWSKCRLPPLKEINLSGRTALDFSSDSKERVTFRHQSYKPHHHSKPWDIEIGFQTRQVWCARSDGKNAMLSLCMPDSFPLTVQSCIMPKDCETTEWSSWSPCSKTCRSGSVSPGFRSRSRNVKHSALGGGKDCPELLEKEACVVVGESLQSCPRYSWRTSEWKECQVSLLLEQQDPRWHVTGPICGGGIQTREVYCAQSVPESAAQRTKEVSRPVEKTLCLGPAPPASQLCNIPCSTDCIVSSWSAWGLCIHENCQDPQGRKGFRMRQRHILMESTGPDGHCPHLVESVPCEDPMCYRWLASEGICIPDHGKCGLGHRILKAVCQNHQGEDVSGILCPASPPPERMACEIPCRMDCVVSEWTEWSSCSQSCSNKNSDGKQTRSRTILALSGEGGKPCPPSQTLQEHRSCNDHSCMQLYWETSPWGSCSEDTLVTALNATIGWNGEATCGVGIQTRRVFCVKSHMGQVTTKRCPESTRPETARPCLLPCRKDCIVTAFSEWTPCPSLCQPGNATIKQSRYRIIIQEAANGGQECPDTLFEERECEDVSLCPMHRWRPQKWSPCILVPESVRQGIMGTSEACGKGVQTRAVLCISDDNKSVEMMECLKQTNGMPPLVQECTVPCRDDCTFTAWSKFTPCSTDCETTRSRRRQLTGKSRKKEKCQDTDLYPLVETQPCPCDEFISQPYGNWSDCILPEGRRELKRGLPVQRDSKECGEGTRFRAIACSDKNGRPVDPSHCSRSGYIQEECIIPCPFDCKLSDWSSWGSCSSSCGIGVRIRSKWLKEKPYNGGRPCPKLDLKNQVHEAVPCYSVCSSYSWLAEHWSPCKIHNELRPLRCGGGTQSRKIRCVSTGDSEGRTVDNSLCNQDEIPPETQSCSLLCPSECVMSEWGPWSKCPQSCDPHSMQRRTRHLLRPSLSSRMCAEDSQVRPCLLNENCFQFQYNLTEWSMCQLSENATCGQGVRTRLLSCVRSDGQSVSMDQCEQNNLEKPQKMSIHCLVECVVNCQLSGWTAWTECSQTCGQGGRMSRTRFIIMPTQGEGRPCPTELTQQKTCPVTPCYSWVLGNWSACKLEGGDCGEGVQIRSLSCMVHNGSISHTAIPVDDALCGDMPFQNSILKQPCSVPCPGDCHLTKWSEWSTCELTCIDGRSFETMGRQSRSRTFIIQSFENQDSCPQQVLETRPCTGGKCYHYTWKASLWNNNERTVWCQRSDGINVTGGCSPQARPAAIRQCNPACRKPFSYCTQGGVCGCEKGYTEILRSNGFLDYCMKVPGSEDKKADVKNLSGKNRPVNSKIHDIFKGWSLQPLEPDGRVKIWVYGVSGGGFLIMIFLVFTSYLVCKKPKPHQSTPPQQKPLTLAYDGDLDM
ncbi:thrombospondin type-1 domain-containing protein 7B isoform X1 [Talpa occidentalis]|uniref:thrombospondin type-1 domain-containing protein 7B isoform X1 n=2 Tax=Talpa occidentalis TaxID=50954 RepID=UPI0023F80610|nr:thrombospondin type-1 domain-containing protein 7B isoform X1 [Talpa occidentalis]XP_054555670.1 thrombospondin type-1 domain-containing protein 7B isoform X1 [Talpa occidentalis]XP_054555671.1 thrombospondin type-1 domain-containing protein 7B isoform X1 [Talpa occidentalis]